MYVRVLFLLCAYLTITNADTDSNEAKYIDLLPEEEKQEFLNRITERIVAEIRSRSNSDKTSVEISDERLNEHSAYVRKIMDEESETLKNKRRHENENDTENADNVEIKVKNDVEEHNSKDILDLPERENRKRTKKDTHGDSKYVSVENRANNEDKVSSVPVNLLYDDDTDLRKTGIDKNAAIKGDMKDDLDETLLAVEGLSTDKQETESKFSQEPLKMDHNTEISDKKNTNTEIESKVGSEVIQVSYPGNEDTESMTDIPQTVNNDYEIQNKTFPEDNKTITVEDAVDNKSKEILSEETETDLLKTTLQMPITEMQEHVESTTESVLDIIQFGTERDVENKSILVDNGNITSNFTVSDYTSTQNNVITGLPTLDNEHFLQTDKININHINATNETVSKIETEEDLQPVTPSVDFRIELTTNESPVEAQGDKIKVKDFDKSNSSNITTKENENKADVKPILRKGSVNFKNSRYQYKDRNRLNLKKSDSLSPSGKNIKQYHVFEISKKKLPFKPVEQTSFEFAEQPHYIPVYNYEPKNAFYSAYNLYGPNFNENHRIFTTEVPHYQSDNSKFNKQDVVRDLINSYTNRGQRNFKPYISNNIYHRPRSIAYQSKLVPVWKEKFPVINFNPNDYLDMDYYLGRSNDASEHNDKVINWKPRTFDYKYVASRENSEDVIDPDPSAEQQNIKENIKQLRHKLFNHKYGNQDELRVTRGKHRQKIKPKFQGHDKKLYPLLRGLDKFLIFLPETGTKYTNNHDFNDKNIAVDYYFSRMNSEELPLFKEDKGKILKDSLPGKVISNIDEGNTIKDEKRSEEHEQVVTEEKHVEIPLQPNHVLKIDIGVKIGNKVDLIFRNVKKPVSNKFENNLTAYLDVLKDMIEHDNKGLVLYDWLGTTVDVLSAVTKLLDMTKSLEARDELHYSDLELIKYILNLFRSSNTLIKDSTKSGKDINKHAAISERNGKRKGSRVINKMKTNRQKPIDVLNKILKYVKEMQQRSINVDDDVLGEFENFLIELQTSLYEIHEAIKQIATVTKFNKQNWFHDLKALYLTPVKRNSSLILLLHLASSKLFGLIEKSAKNGLEDNFLIYAQNHRAEVNETRENFIFVLRLLKEIKKNNI